MHRRAWRDYSFGNVKLIVFGDRMLYKNAENVKVMLDRKVYNGKEDCKNECDSIEIAR